MEESTMTALLREVIGDVLRRARTEPGRPLREVADSARGSLGYLSEVERGQKEAVLAGHHARVTAVSFSPDNEWLVSVGQDAIVIRWNLEKRRPDFKGR
jgi:WD40 repeat protein